MSKIAVIGIANLFPGSHSLDNFWQGLLDKKDFRRRATVDEMGVDPELYFGKEGESDKYYCLSGGYIRDFQFDSQGYQLPSDYLNQLDDLYKWLLYVGDRALADAGYKDKADVLKRCGVILGNLSFPTKKSNHLFMPLYHKTVEHSLQQLLNDESFTLANFSKVQAVHPANGLIAGYPAAVLAQSLGLGGSHFALDAACASSCYSVKFACDYLTTGKSDLMLAGAVSCSDPFFINMGFSIFHAYPDDNVSAPLDKTSGGLFAGEGAGMMVLKRYEDALRDGDHIHAVIRGGALSNDGKGEFVLSPNTKGQVLVYERAYENAELDPAKVDFVECHATGTPKGDKVELTSMETFFSRYDRKPLIGSVKSNLGHLLTAAGMPGMTKTIMAMNAGEIPPTINLTNPVVSKNGYINGEQMPTETIPWPDHADHPRTAGVSVFGFGGSNAHIVFEQHNTNATATTSLSATSPFQPMSIVAMDAHFGGCEGLQQFTDSTINGRQHFTSLPKMRWKGIDLESTLLKDSGLPSGVAPQGAYIESFEIDFLRFKIPPNENDSLIPQQLMMIRTADNAAKQANLKPGSNVAVLVAMGVELELHQFRGRVNLATQLEESLAAAGISLNADQRQELINIAKNSVHNAAQLNQYTSFIGNIMASRISSLWDFSGPAITVSAEENSVYRALELAESLFNTSDVDAIIVAAVDLAGSAEHVLLRNQFMPVQQSGKAFSYLNDVSGWRVGEGAGAVVLKRSQDAEADGSTIFAQIDAIHLSNGVTANDVANTAKTALQSTGYHASNVDYVEVNASGYAEHDMAERAGLADVYNNVTIGSVKANIGHTFSASGMASLIKTAACIVHQKLPAMPDCQTDMALDSFAKIPAKTTAWNNAKRVAAISGLGFDGCSAHLILSNSKKPFHLSPQSETSDKPKPKLNKTVYLGGKNIQECILTTENINRFQTASSNRTATARYDSLEGIKLNLVRSGARLSLPSNKQEQQREAAMSSASTNNVKNINWSLNQLMKLQHIETNISQAAKAHSVFLDSRVASVKQMAELIGLQMAVSGSPQQPAQLTAVQSAEPVKPKIVLKENYSQPENIIWDTAELVEFAEGSIAKVFGDEFASIDQYSRRVRLPTTDYLLVTRVTELDAKINEYKPSKMTTEYDIPTDAPYLIDGQIPWCVSVESGQCDLLLISYLGIDFQNKGERVYRLLDCTLTFLEDMALGGETLRYEIYIDSFARNGDTLLFFFHYDCFVGDKKVLIMRGGCAGFFTDEELADGKGVILTEEEKEARKQIPKSSFTPLIESTQTQFEYDDILKLIEGDVAGCFGPQYIQHDKNTSLKFSSKKFLMIERVTKIDRTGGPWGLGLLEGEKRLEPDHWYFPCHFKDDQVMAGSLMAEGCGQLVMFFMLYLGMQEKVSNARFQPMPGEAQKVRCRGQVLPQSNTLTYRMEVTEIGLDPQPYMKANVDIILDGKVVVDFKNLGVIMKESTLEERLLSSSDQAASTFDSLVQSSPKDPFANPNAPLMKVEHDTQAVPNKGVIPIKHFEAPYVEGQNREPNTLPFEPWHLFEFATGDISNCFGSDYDIYKGLIPPRTPCGDLQLTTRVVAAEGKRGDLKSVSSCKAEYEVPHDAWYFEKNSHSRVMPYSILMEIALQPNGFLSTYMGSTLGFPGKELFFRNLDGSGKLLRDVDLRGKTIVNDSTLVSTSIAGANIIQSFTFLLSVDGEPFYDGKAVFGYFAAEALANQLGIDNGRQSTPWHIEHNRQAERIDLTQSGVPLFAAKPGKPHYHLAGGQLHFIDHVDVVEQGGKAGKGYVYAERKIDPSDWFFQFHFHQDPVMPGSLGVEAIIETMQVWALKNDLGARFKNPRFGQILSTIVWKYRGQIIPTNEKMSLDVHITDVIEDNDKVTVIGDANLMKDGLRIYEVKDIAICIQEAE